MDFRIIELQKQLSENEKNLQKVGADIILGSISELQKVSLDLFKKIRN